MSLYFLFIFHFLSQQKCLIMLIIVFLIFMLNKNCIKECLRIAPKERNFLIIKNLIFTTKKKHSITLCKLSLTIELIYRIFGLIYSTDIAQLMVCYVDKKSIKKEKLLYKNIFINNFQRNFLNKYFVLFIKIKYIVLKSLISNE